MKLPDLVGSAVANTFRSKTRTLLTILAIFIGAFTLTLTSGLGTGINRYIDDTVTAIGASDVMTVVKTAEQAIVHRCQHKHQHDTHDRILNLVGDTADNFGVNSAARGAADHQNAEND